MTDFETHRTASFKGKRFDNVPTSLVTVAPLKNAGAYQHLHGVSGKDNWVKRANKLPHKLTRTRTY